LGTILPERLDMDAIEFISFGRETCMLSVARIPFLGRSFTGFLGFVSIGGELTRFATYTGARITLLEQSIDECRIMITTRKESIEFIARSTERLRLTAPRHGSMNRLISRVSAGLSRLKVTEADAPSASTSEEPWLESNFPRQTTSYYE
jgi:hypothetical protein